MNGLFDSAPQQPDMSVMYPYGQDNAPAPMPNMAPTMPAENAPPVYVGDPVIDKYIHSFIGTAV